MLPKTTRLRFVRSKKADNLILFLENLGVRVQIYGAPVWDGKKWYLWFVPDDRGEDPLKFVGKGALWIDLD